jgi:hypothetical protein
LAEIFAENASYIRASQNRGIIHRATCGRELLSPRALRHYRSDVDAHTHAEVIEAVFIDIGQLLADPQSVIRHGDYVLEIPHVAGAFR